MKNSWKPTSLLCMVLLAGCASGLTVPSTDKVYAPEPGKALVVFYAHYGRTGLMGFDRPALSVYQVVGDGQDLVGFLDARTKVAYQSPPGDQLFMVNAENIDFMEAHLLAGKTYYVLVHSREGFATDRFSLLPFRNSSNAKRYGSMTALIHNMSSAWFSLLSTAPYVEPTEKARAWYSSNRAEVDKKRRGYLGKWNARTTEEKVDQTLNKEDGV